MQEENRGRALAKVGQREMRETGGAGSDREEVKGLERIPGRNELVGRHTGEQTEEASPGVRDKRIKSGTYFGCDHTSTNAPDPIRTPQLSVLGRE